MTPQEYIIEVISAAMDNAHDMGMGDFSDAYAVGTVTIEIMYGEGGETLEGGYFEIVDDRFTRDDLQPHLLAVVADLTGRKV